MSRTLEELVNELSWYTDDVDTDALRAELAELRQKAYTLDWLERHGRYPGPPPGLRPASPPQGHPHLCLLCDKVLASHPDYVRHMCQHMAHIEPRWEADRERPASAWYAGQYATYTNATLDTRYPRPAPDEEHDD